MTKSNTRLIALIGLISVLLIGMLGYGCATNTALEAGHSSPNATPIGSTTLPSHSSSMTNPPRTDTSRNPSNSSDSSTFSNSPTHDPASANNPDGMLNNDRFQSMNTQIVRPEVRHILQAKYQDKYELQTALKGAAILQSYLEQPNQDAVILMKHYDCTVISLTQADQNFIKTLTFDDLERKNKIMKGLKNYQPPVSTEINIDGNGDAISPCALL